MTLPLPNFGPGTKQGAGFSGQATAPVDTVASASDEIALPAIPTVPGAQIDMHLLHELFVRARNSAAIGIPGIVLMAYIHTRATDAVSAERIWLWLGIMLVLIAFRLILAQKFLAQPVSEQTAYRTWFLLAVVSAACFALGWVSSMSILAGPEIDRMCYMRMLFLGCLAAFMLATLGVETRVYGAFLVAFGIGVLGQLYALYPAQMARQPEIAVAVLVYLAVLFRRSLEEQRHTREWIETRLAQGALVGRLYEAIEHEQAATRRLKTKSEELETINQRLHELATHDGLTKAFNRSHMQRVLRQSIYAYNRYGQEFSALLLDVDYFKSVNDNYGHAAGDEVLCRIVGVAHTCLRDADLFGRWGGEEFLALLPNTNLEQAVCAAERLRKAVAGQTFSHDGVEFVVTVSIGASMAQQHKTETPETLIDRADRALYAAKHGGRDCVMAAPAI